MSVELDEVVAEFLVESHENLDRLDRDLVTLEQDPNNRETLASIFRTIHTIKGTCGFLGFTKLESVTHVGESLLSRSRDGLLQLSPEITSALLATVDAVRDMLSHIEHDGGEGGADYSALVETLARLQDASNDGPPTAASEAVEATAEEVPAIGEMLVDSGVVAQTAVDAAIRQQADGDPRHVGEILVDRGEVQPAEVVDALKAQNEQRASLSDSNIRVDVGLLDKLMNLVGELVLARNQVLQYTASQTDATFIGTSQRLNLITTELQEGVMKTRMQPIGNVWSKFPRVVRDLALACGKQIRLEMEGRETELDKTIIEAIKDPLTHLVRNSVDHGVETPEARQSSGKPAEGRIMLRAFHEGGHVNIEISDDGAGINVERVRAKAIAKGLVNPDQATRMNDRELASLVFLPGFSTAEKVTNVSGRGVGMDVVKTNIEKIGGTVDLTSNPGVGTTFRIKIPLTLAIIPALIVTSGGDRYAIPQVSLVELVRLEGEQARTGVEYIHGAPVCRLRGNLLPLVDLSKELGVNGSGRFGVEPAGGPAGEVDGGAAADLSGAAGGTERGTEHSTADGADVPGNSDHEADAVNIVVLQADDRQFGLVVERVNDTEEIVVKPLSKQLKGLSAYAGATIMGDGKVALILDALGLAQRGGVVNERRDRSLVESRGAAEERTDDRQTLLLFAVGDTGRMAIPLSIVARLEEFPRESVERAGDREVVQYRDKILPLVRLAGVLGEKVSEDHDSPVQVVVYNVGDRRFGLVVERILDIVEERYTLQQVETKRGVQGSAVIQQRVTDILDVPAIIRTVDPSFFADSESESEEPHTSELVDAS